MIPLCMNKELLRCIQHPPKTPAVFGIQEIRGMNDDIELLLIGINDYIFLEA